MSENGHEAAEPSARKAAASEPSFGKRLLVFLNTKLGLLILGFLLTTLLGGLSLLV